MKLTFYLILFAQQALYIFASDEDRLLMAIEICRHGARSPVDQRQNITQTYWQDGEGMLTEVGMRQHYLIGKELRKRYIDQHKLLSPFYNSNQLLVQSSFKERCYMSAQSQLQGLFPLNGQKLPVLNQLQKQKSTLPIPDPDDDLLQIYAEVERELSTDQVLAKHLYQQETIPIYQFDETDDFLLRAHSEKTCAKVQNYQEQFWKTSDEMKNLIEQYNAKLFQPLAQRLPQHFENTFNYKWGQQARIVDEILCTVFDQRQLPFNISQNDLEIMHQFVRDDFYVRKFGSLEAALLGSSDLRKFIANQFQDRVSQQSERRLIILSAHDTTLTMLLSAMNLKQNKSPPFASQIIFELWNKGGKNFVKLLYNDVALDLGKYCYEKSGQLCDFDTFKSKILVSTHEDLRSECSSKIDSELFFFGFLSDNGSTIKNAGSGVIALGVVIFLSIVGLIIWWCYKKASKFETSINNEKDRFELVEIQS